ncbi:MAG: hypothetical protein UU47_C0004G0001 [candidate division TM6 bacterium GW2011_GWE2_41_16]|nr:MAG: hypothetical protein UU47_C0004G0001 [candidate division TM6 bacterium GW2011_GWE2_41_16]
MMLLCFFPFNASSVSFLHTSSCHKIFSHRFIRYTTLPTITCLCVAGVICVYAYKQKKLRRTHINRAVHTTQNNLPHIVPIKIISTPVLPQKQHPTITPIPALIPVQPTPIVINNEPLADQQKYRLPQRPNKHQPPNLRHGQNDCWVNTSLQFLLAMPELYDGLVSNSIQLEPPVQLDSTEIINQIHTEPESIEEKMFQTLACMYAWNQEKTLPAEFAGKPYPRDICIQQNLIDISGDQKIRCEQFYTNIIDWIKHNHLEDDIIAYNSLWAQTTRLAYGQPGRAHRLITHMLAPIGRQNSLFIQLNPSINSTGEYFVLSNKPAPLYMLSENFAGMAPTAQTNTQHQQYDLVAAGVNLHEQHWIAYVYKNNSWYSCNDDGTMDNIQSGINLITQPSPEYDAMLKQFLWQTTPQGGNTGFLYLYRKRP